jgi:hypothetical protein
MTMKNDWTHMRRMKRERIAGILAGVLLGGACGTATAAVRLDGKAQAGWRPASELDRNLVGRQRR